MKQNTIGDRLKNFKTFLEVLFQSEVITCNPFKKYSITIPKERASTIALNEEELQGLIDLDLSSNPTYELVRDKFYLLCQIGVRISDFNTFLEHARNNHVVKIYNQKTLTEIMIPVSNKARMILEKYDYNLPDISEQKMNEYIKIIGEMVPALQSLVQIRYTKGGRDIVENVTKYSQISIHTSRRTLITTLRNGGMDSGGVTIMSGHATEEMVSTYYKNDGSRNLKQILEILNK
jgi:site-specific recombinase XerD